MNNFKISIIIPIYNGIKFIERCINSIKKQTYTNYEIIAIDDGSSDSSFELLKKIQSTYNKLYIYKEDNKGVSAARNLGLQKCTGDLVTFVDVDDEIETTMLEELIQLMEKDNSDISIAFSKEHPNLTGRNICIFSSDYDFETEYSTFTAWGCLFKKNVIKDLKFNEEIFISEDILFKASAIKNSYKISILYKPLYIYNYYPNSACHCIYNKKKLTEITAWELISQIYNKTKQEVGVQKVLISRILYILCQYQHDKTFTKDDFEFCVSKYKQHGKKIKRYMNFKDKVKFYFISTFPKTYLFLRKLK